MESNLNILLVNKVWTGQLDNTFFALLKGIFSTQKKSKMNTCNVVGEYIPIGFLNLGMKPWHEENTENSILCKTIDPASMKGGVNEATAGDPSDIHYQK